MKGKMPLALNWVGEELGVTSCQFASYSYKLRLFARHEYL
jgi:hypothetical protein